MSYKTGKSARGRNAAVPHLSAILAGRGVATPPAAVDQTDGMPADLGMMLNDHLNDCTCAAFYHALQVWSFHAGGAVQTEPDENVRRLYIEACGYDPAKGGEGAGGVVQQVLAFLHHTGAPTGPSGEGRNRIAAFVEIDPRLTEDVKHAIADCGLAYVGFQMPRFILPDGGHPPPVWDVQPAASPIIGGHAVILTGYSDTGLTVISWGKRFTMTWAFFKAYVDEVYALADHAWITAKRTTPGGLSLRELEAQMKTLKQGR